MLAGRAGAQQQELFRAQMLTEMARMSVEDGLVMQIHPGSARNHNRQLYGFVAEAIEQWPESVNECYGRDIGADIPTPTNYAISPSSSLL